MDGAVNIGILDEGGRVGKLEFSDRLPCARRSSEHVTGQGVFETFGGDRDRTAYARRGWSSCERR
jgi:hypothetical protein